MGYHTSIRWSLKSNRLYLVWGSSRVKKGNASLSRPGQIPPCSWIYMYRVDRKEVYDHNKTLKTARNSGTQQMTGNFLCNARRRDDNKSKNTWKSSCLPKGCVKFQPVKPKHTKKQRSYEALRKEREKGKTAASNLFPEGCMHNLRVTGRLTAPKHKVSAKKWGGVVGAMEQKLPLLVYPRFQRTGRL